MAMFIHRLAFAVLKALLILPFSFYLGKAFLVWATFFVLGLTFSNGSQVPKDPVFDCLNTNTRRASQCYVSS